MYIGSGDLFIAYRFPTLRKNSCFVLFLTDDSISVSLKSLFEGKVEHGTERCGIEMIDVGFICPLKRTCCLRSVARPSCNPWRPTSSGCFLYSKLSKRCGSEPLEHPKKSSCYKFWCYEDRFHCVYNLSCATKIKSAISSLTCSFFRNLDHTVYQICWTPPIIEYLSRHQDSTEAVMGHEPI